MYVFYVPQTKLPWLLCRTMEDVEEEAQGTRGQKRHQNGPFI